MPWEKSDVGLGEEVGDQKGLGPGKAWGKRGGSRVHPGLCNSSIIKVFRVHESSCFVNINDNCGELFLFF